MGKKAMVKWNANQLKTIKKNLLFFEELYYDPFLHSLQTTYLRNISKALSMKESPGGILDELDTTVDYLVGRNILKSFNLNHFKEGKLNLKPLTRIQKTELLKEVNRYDKVHKQFQKKYDESVDLLEKDFKNGLLKFVSLGDDFSKFSDYHVRLSSAIIKITKDEIQTTPIVDDWLVKFGKETEVIKLVINNLPIPEDMVPLDEIIDFRNDSDNKRRYLGLISWLNKISKSSLNVNEIEDEIEYLTLEFANRMKLEKQNFKLSTIEVIIRLPVTIVQNLLTITWSDIPKSLFQIQKNRINLLIAESKADGKEMSYIWKANKAFGRKN